MPFSILLLITLACIPFDVPIPGHFLTSLSLIDFLSAAALLVTIWHYPRLELKSIVRRDIGWVRIFAWGVFMAYGFMEALTYAGSIRPLLRCGEFLFFCLLATLARRENPTLHRSLAQVLSWTGAACSVWAIAQFAATHGDYTRTFAGFGQHNGLGAFLSLTLSAAWASAIGRSRYSIYTGFALLNTLAWMLAFSRGAWLGIACGILLVFLWRRSTGSPFWMGVLLASFMLLSAACPILWIRHYPEKGLMAWATSSNVATVASRSSTRGLSQRPYYWYTAWKMIGRHPWRGLGPAQYAPSVRDYLEGSAQRLYDYEMAAKHRVDFWVTLHSLYLQQLVEYGWLGYLLWVFAMTTLMIPSFSSPHEAPAWRCLFLVSIVGFIVHNTVDILFVNSMDLLFMTLLVVCRPPSDTSART